jgi:hypothetical protein
VRASKAKLDEEGKNWSDKKHLRALGAALADPFGFWAPTLIALAAALAAMTQVYGTDVAWGGDALSSLIALAGTAITAAGLGTFISSLKGS